MKPFIALCLAALVGGCTSQAAVTPSASSTAQNAPLPVISEDDLTPRWLTTAQIEALPRRFPEFELIDQSGKTVERGDLDGHIVVANFFFTGCASLCPRLKNSMAKVRDAYAGADDVRLISHSVTPELDQPKVLTAYAKANGVDGKQWKLLTGERAVLEKLTHEGYLVPRAQPSDGAVLHTEWLILLDQQQRVRGIYNGTLPIEVGWLIRDLQLLRNQPA